MPGVELDVQEITFIPHATKTLGPEELPRSRVSADARRTMRAGGPSNNIVLRNPRQAVCTESKAAEREKRASIWTGQKKGTS